MAHSSANLSIHPHPRTTTNHPPASRFADPLDCLTAHLLLEGAQVLAGIKPANLISLVNRTLPCGRNLYHLWHEHRAHIAAHLTAMSFKVLQTRERALLLFCYNPNHLDRHLSHAGIRALLGKAGYDVTLSGAALLNELCRRMEQSAAFPHEIGLFIGYPAKDVAAFMGMVRLPFACQGPWKIYGNPGPSLGLAERYRCCRQRMKAILASGNRNALELDNPAHPFFCPAFDNNHQFQGGTHP